MHGLDSKHSLILGSSNLSIPLIFPLVIAAETAKVTKMAAIFQCHFIYPGRYIENHKNILVTKSINFRFEYRNYFIEIHLPAKIKPRTDFDILLVWEYLVLNINNWNEIIAYFFRYLVYIMADKGWLLIFFNHEKWWVIYQIGFFYDRFIVLIAILKLPNGLCYALWSVYSITFISNNHLNEMFSFIITSSRKVLKYWKRKCINCAHTYRSSLILQNNVEVCIIQFEGLIRI